MNKFIDIYIKYHIFFLCVHMALHSHTLLWGRPYANYTHKDNRIHQYKIFGLHLIVLFMEIHF